MRSSPWFHEKRSESAPPAQRPRDPPSISQKKQEEITDRISRPTESALYRQSLYWKLDSFMDRGFHSWSKMDLFDDCKRCMWTPDGAIKGTCKIRPLKTSADSLPPLRSSFKGLNGNGRRFGSLTTRFSRESLTTPKHDQNNGNGRSSSNGSATCRSSMGEAVGYITTNNTAAFANGMAALGGVNGARYKLSLHNTNRLAKPAQYPAKVNSLAVPRVGESRLVSSTL